MVARIRLRRVQYVDAGLRTRHEIIGHFGPSEEWWGSIRGRLRGRDDQLCDCELWQSWESRIERYRGLARQARHVAPLFERRYMSAPTGRFRILRSGDYV